MHKLNRIRVKNFNGGKKFLSRSFLIDKKNYKLYSISNFTTYQIGKKCVCDCACEQKKEDESTRESNQIRNTIIYRSKKKQEEIRNGLVKNAEWS